VPDHCIYGTAKRALDLMVSLPALILLCPAFLATAILVRLKLGSPIFFRQERAGQNGKPFTIYKFRTMTDAKGPGGNLLPDEARLTPIGSFLRRSSLDELPQLVNVALGQMSLVGPRPLYRKYIPRYSEHHKMRLLVPPGITGWAQVNGRNAVDWEKRLDLDVHYVNHRSLALDLWILCLTFRKVLAREGISAQNHATMEEFMGSGPTAG